MDLPNNDWVNSDVGAPRWSSWPAIIILVASHALLDRKEWRLHVSLNFATISSDIWSSPVQRLWHSTQCSFKSDGAITSLGKLINLHLWSSCRVSYAHAIWSTYPVSVLSWEQRSNQGVWQIVPKLTMMKAFINLLYNTADRYMGVIIEIENYYHSNTMYVGIMHLNDTLVSEIFATCHGKNCILLSVNSCDLWSRENILATEDLFVSVIFSAKKVSQGKQ